MKIEIVKQLQIMAKPIDDHYGDLKAGELYEVEDIHMGQSSTSVYLKDKKGSCNSVHFEFYIGDYEINIYKSGLINGYATLHLPGIWYMDGKDGRI